MKRKIEMLWESNLPTVEDDVQAFLALELSERDDAVKTLFRQEAEKQDFV